MLICLVLFIPFSYAEAQENDTTIISNTIISTNDSVTQTINQPKGAPIFFYRLARIIETMLMKGIDSTYLSLYDHSWKIALINGETGIYDNIRMSNMPKYGDVDLNLKSSPSIALGFAAAWHTLQFNYSWDIFYRRTRKLDFAILNRAWGIELIHHVNTNINGLLKVQNIGNYAIENGDMEISTTFLSMYFIFNSEKYSTYSALRQAYIQKQSAGSFYLQAQYLGTKMKTVSESLIDRMNNLSNFEVHQAAISAGYGYNYTPNGGKFLLHVSAAPMAVVFNRTILTFTYPLIYDKEKHYEEFQKVVDPKLWFYITGTARVAISWDINEWCYLAANAQFYYMRFNSKKYDELTLKINTWEWNANLTFGARFGVNRKKMKQTLEQYDAARAVNPTKPDILDWVEKMTKK